MEYRIKEWNPTTGAEVRTLGYLKSVNYQAQCNETSDLRFGALLNEVLTVDVFNSSEAQLTQGAWVSFEAKNNPAADDTSRTNGYSDIEWTFYGVYKVDSVKDGKGYYTFVAYPSTHDLNVDYSARLKYLVDSGSFPMTAQELLEDACQYIGMSAPVGADVELSRMTVKQFYANGITVKDIVCAAAELMGCFVIDIFGESKTAPTSPMPTQRGVEFQHYTLRVNTKSDVLPQVDGYYLIAPTDAPVEHSAFDIDNPRYKRILFSNVYYKENGFSAGDQVNKLTGGELVVPNGDSISLPGQTGVTNVYRVTNNILASNATIPSVADIAFVSYANDAIDRQSTIRLFPFFCPFRCGDIAFVTNGNGISYQMPIMYFTLNDSEAVLSCSGNEFYETAQNQYSTADQSTQSNAVEIGKIRADVDALDSFARGAIVTRDMAAGTNYNFILDDGTRFALFTASNVDTARALYIFNTANSGGAVTYSAVKSGSAITLTTGTNSLTVRSSNTGAMGFFVFKGRVTPTT